MSHNTETSPTAAAMVPRSKVLVVDDEKSIRTSLCAFLNAAGYETDMAEDAHVAEQRLAENDYDVVVTDIVLPGVSGVALLEQIRATAPAVPVIMMTGEPTVDTASAALRAGAFDYLTKPVNKNAILRSVLSAERTKTMNDQRRQLEEANHRYRAQLEELVQDRTAELQAALSELQETQTQLVQQERMSALGQMASGIAHDFNNVLMPILGLSDYLLSHPDMLRDVEDTVKMLETINSAARDAKEVVRRLREFYRPSQELETAAVNLKELVGYVLHLSEPRWKSQAQAESQPIELQDDLPASPPVEANEAQIREVFMNLILNAVDAMPAGGRLRLGGTFDDTHVTVEVSDSGDGMSPEVQRRCMEPFFTTKKQHGTGLGLSLCHGIVKRHAGTLHITSEAGTGTTVTVRLPLHGPTVSVAAAPRTPAPAEHAGAQRILAVDDNELSLILITRYLADAGHMIETASNAEDALAKLAGGDFDVVVTDRAMPGMGGDELARAAKRLHPHAAVVMVTGFGDLMEFQGEQIEGVDQLVSKPITQAELLDAVDKAAGRGRAIHALKRAQPDPQAAVGAAQQ